MYSSFCSSFTTPFDRFRSLGKGFARGSGLGCEEYGDRDREVPEANRGMRITHTVHHSCSYV